MKIKKKYIFFLIIICFTFLLFKIIRFTNEDTKINNKSDERNNESTEIEIPNSQEIMLDLKKESPNKEHPRLLATNNDFLTIKKSINSDIYLKKWYEELSKDSNELLNTPLVKYEKTDGIRLLPVSQTVLDRTIILSMMYRLSGDSRFADRAWKELEIVSNNKVFPDWNPSHFLDTAEMATAVGIGYDWLYDYLKPEQKEILQNALINNAFYPALKVYNNTVGQENITTFWKDVSNNWNTVCNSGLLLSSLAIADESYITEKISGDIAQKAMESVTNSLKTYKTIEGGTEEGPGYWNYSTKYITFLISAMDTSLGTDYGYSSYKGLSETGYYPIYITGPTGVFNTGDSAESFFNNIPQLLWFSKKYGIPEIRSLALNNYNPLNFLWYQKSENLPENTSNLPLDKNFKDKKTGVVTMRESWQPNSIFVGIHAGYNQANHGDLDIGTFVLDAQGVRWANELGADNYNLPGYFDKILKRWTYYRKSTEGQNTLVINPNKNANQKKDAVGKITKFISNKKEASVTIDMSTAYEDTKKVQRKLSLINNRSKVQIEDTIKLNEESEIYWFMHTKTNIGLSTDKKNAVLVRDGKVLYAHIVSPSLAEFSIMEAKPIQVSPSFNLQNKNENYRKLTIHLQNTLETRITVEFSTEPLD